MALLPESSREIIPWFSLMTIRLHSSLGFPQVSFRRFSSVSFGAFGVFSQYSLTPFSSNPLLSDSHEKNHSSNLEESLAPVTYWQ